MFHNHLIVLLLMLAAVGGAFFTGRIFPSRKRLDDEYNAGVADEYHRLQARQDISEDDMDMSEGTFEYLFSAGAQKPSYTRTPLPEPVAPAPTAEITAEPEDEEYFQTLTGENGCLFCYGGEGDCNCVERCKALACEGWASTDDSVAKPVVSYEMALAQCEDQSREIEEMCAKMDRETKDYLAEMESKSRLFMAARRVEDAQQLHALSMAGRGHEKHYVQVMDSDYTQPMEIVEAEIVPG